MDGVSGVVPGTNPLPFDYEYVNEDNDLQLISVDEDYEFIVAVAVSPDGDKFVQGSLGTYECSYVSIVVSINVQETLHRQISATVTQLVGTHSLFMMSELGLASISFLITWKLFVRSVLIRLERRL